MQVKDQKKKFLRLIINCKFNINMNVINKKLIDRLRMKS